LTIPAILPREEQQPGQQTLHTPFQAVGARGVNNLASKLLLALLPPTEPFFRFTIDDFMVGEIARSVGLQEVDMRGTIEEALGGMERAVQNRMEQVGVRTSLFETIKQLIVTGNSLLFVGNRGSLRTFRLDEYVIKRDPNGTVLEIITKEMLSLSNLPDKVKPLVENLPKEDSNRSAQKTIPMYTWVTREPGKWKVHQEVMDKWVPGSEGEYPLKKSPWIPLRYTQIDGEDYGRGFVEEYIGDLMSLEGLSQALVEAAAAAAKIVFLVQPGGVTSRKKLSAAPSGAFINGFAEDVTVLQLEKLNDFAVAQAEATKIEKRLSAAFMLSSTMVRDAERVTAEEIRIVAGELEDALGGIYSLLSQELQVPLVTRVMHQMTKAKELPPLPAGVIKPQIITGLDALGRRHDLDRMDVFIQRATMLVGEQNLPIYLHPGPILRRVATALGIDTRGVVKTKEEIQAEQQQQARQEMLKAATPEAVAQVGKLANVKE
jgi:hypothetical protein